MANLGIAPIGFELQNKTAGVEGETFTGTTAISTSIKYGGAASLRCNPTAATGYLQHTFRADAVADIYGKFMLYIATGPSAATQIWGYGDSSNFYGAQLRLNTNLTLTATNSGASLTTNGSATLATATWYRIECFYDETGNTLTVKIATADGTASTDISAAAVDDVGGGGRMRFGVIGSTTADIYIDDIVVSDSAYPGAGRVVVALPTAAGDNAATTGIFSYINEIPSTDTATSGSTMVELDNNGTIGDYNVTDSSTLGINSGDTISEVSVVARMREDISAVTSYQMRIKSASGGTTSSSSAADVGNTTARTNPSGTTNFGIAHRRTTDPTTSAAWTPTGTNSIDNMQIGVSSGTANDIWVLGLYAMILYVPSAGSTTPQTITGKARVEKSVSQTATGKARIEKSASQTVTGKARIQKSVTQTIAGVARITATTLRTATGVARITATTLQTASGKASILRTTLQTVTGVSRITKVVSQTVVGVSRITVTTTRTVQGLARITATASQTATGKARITASTLRTVTGLARIELAVSRTITGLARITVNTSRTITGKARIQKAATQTVTGKARVTSTTIQIQTGVARITATTSQATTGKARIERLIDQTIDGLARLLIGTTQTITGKSRITATTSQNQVGRASIQLSISQTTSGRSRIEVSTSRNITGLGRVTAAVSRLITGQSSVINLQSRNITGAARIIGSIPGTPIALTSLPRNGYLTGESLAGGMPADNPAGPLDSNNGSVVLSSENASGILS